MPRELNLADAAASALSS